jgi:hypothetical protein
VENAQDELLGRCSAVGKLSWKQTFPGGQGPSSACPPWASATARTIERPRPVPPSSRLVVTNRRNNDLRTWSSNVPSLMVRICTSLGDELTKMRTFEPGGE